MPGDLVKFAFVIEGKGEVEAIPLLIRRICTDILGFYAFKTTRPVRIPRSTLVRPGELERAIRLAQTAADGRGPVFVVLDADEDAPCELGPRLKARALMIAHASRLSIVIPKYEFETWFLAAAESLGGCRGLWHGIEPPPSPEAIRGAKEWLSQSHDSRQEVFAQCRSSRSGGRHGFERSKIVPIIRPALPGGRTLGSVLLNLQPFVVLLPPNRRHIADLL